MIVFKFFLLVFYTKCDININRKYGVIETALPNDLLVTRGRARTTITVKNKIAIGINFLLFVIINVFR